MRPTTENLLFGPTPQPARHDAHAGRLERRGGRGARRRHRPLAQGSDGGGSIRIPAACCGVVGHKPTRGLVSGAPASYDAWEGFATNGPMARTVADCALMLEVMAGPEPGDAYAPPPHDGAFAAACAEDPAPLRIGVSRDPPPASSTTRSATIFDAALEPLAHMGHRLERGRRRRSPRSWRRSRRSCSARRRRCASSCRRSASTCSSSTTRDGRRRRRAHRRRRVRAGRRGGARAARPPCSRRWRPTSSSSPPC